MPIRADCIQAQGEYTLGAGGVVTITVDAATLAACPEGSLSEAVLEWLLELACKLPTVAGILSTSAST